MIQTFVVDLGATKVVWEIDCVLHCPYPFWEVQNYKKTGNHVVLYPSQKKSIATNHPVRGWPGLFRRTFRFRLWLQTFWLLVFEVCWDLRQRQIWLFERWDQEKIEPLLFSPSVKRLSGHRIVEIEGGDHSEKTSVCREILLMEEILHHLGCINLCK